MRDCLQEQHARESDEPEVSDFNSSDEGEEDDNQQENDEQEDEEQEDEEQEDEEQEEIVVPVPPNQTVCQQITQIKQNFTEMARF